MDQETRWMLKYNEVKSFIESHLRNPSKHDPEERYKYYNRLKHNRQLINAGEMKCERMENFKELLELSENNKHKNQYQ